MFPFLFYLFIINNISFLFHDYDWGVVGLCWFGQTSDISEKIKSKADAATSTQKCFSVYFCLFVFLSCKRYLTKNPVHCQCLNYSIDEIVVHTKSNISKTVAEAKVKSWKVSVQV